ncbi:MAG: hypothetical protein IT265_11885 [Saprospiraceae bacterium]|nr:hypothetical protein [Saprospiraceae bacterium]
METGEQIDHTVGRCNREINCGYHYTPTQYFQDNPEKKRINTFSVYKPHKNSSTYKFKTIWVKPNHKDFIPVEIFKQSLQIGKTIIKIAETNNFIKFLVAQFGIEHASLLVSRYFIGSSRHWNGATVFWQIDNQGRIRTGKIMLYNSSNGKRVKKPINHISWAHKQINQEAFQLSQCFFGSHLLINCSKPIALVESEKTAIIASIYLPQFIWLAVGGLSNLNAEMCNILKGREVTLFPDLSKPKESDLTAFEKWEKRAKELSHITTFNVSALLEHNATEAERKQGLDLADYLLRFNYKEFNLEPSKPPLITETLPESQPNEENNQIQHRSSPAYVSETEELYIETPIGTTYTIYPSIDHYNNRLCLPDFIDKDKISIDGFKVVQINLDLLKIILKED